jgi:hypothetical protein
VIEESSSAASWVELDRMAMLPQWLLAFAKALKTPVVEPSWYSRLMA